jgi:hypothetical protein
MAVPKIPMLESLHPNAATLDARHYLKGYPIRLLTRRTYSLNADRIAQERENAPQSVRCTESPPPTHHPRH